MEWIDKMNDALNYIEDHLLEETDYKAIAAQAGCSSYNFQRMFSFITDIPLAEYIRRRRLTLAGTELSDMSKTILDVAFKYGYDSSSSFSRAFRAMHGINPSGARQDGATLKAFPRISFNISIKGDSKTEGYDIAHIPAQTYAIFPSELFDWDADFGKVMDDLQKKFYSEWLPTSIYEQVDGPSFEIYGGTAENGYIELWYPIRKKQEQI